MSMPPALTNPKRSQYEALPDRGCSVWPQFVSCPWRVWVAELPAREHTTFVHALRLVRSYLAAPDRTIAG